MKTVRTICLALLLNLVSSLLFPQTREAAVADGDLVKQKPNFVLIFTDDQGYGDLSCFGGEHVSTPRIDQMAAEGARLTSFYVAAPVCTPSRAALMTGCYPQRVSMGSSDFGVLLAGDSKGLHPDEITIAEVLLSAGYRTGMMFCRSKLSDNRKIEMENFALTTVFYCG